MSNEKRSQAKETKEDTLILDQVKTEKPRRYFVVMHNDDYTTQEFVVKVLIQFFHKSEQEAHRLMLLVHTQGKAEVGLYPKDLALTKVKQVTDYAKQNGMPLLLNISPE